MSKYSIAWMPGDGIGNDVMEATRIVLDAMKLDAEYIHCDIGWEFWCKEGNPLPDRSIEILKKTTCGLFGAITSKPQDEAKAELAPELKAKNPPLVYFSPIVKLRQMFNLHTNMRPCKTYEGNPLNYRGSRLNNPEAKDILLDQVVLVVDGRIYRRVPSTAIKVTETQVPAEQPAQQPRAASPAAAAAPDAGEGTNTY